MRNYSFDELFERLHRIERKLDAIESKANGMGHAKPTPEPADLIDIHVASVIIGKAVSTIYSMVNRNEIPYMKRGNRLYFSREELRNWIRDTRNRTVDECKEEVRSDLRNRSRV